jgi:hypothetical protein
VKKAHLCCLACPCMKDFLLMLKRCTNLRRLTNCKKTYFPFVLCDFILELKDLKFVHITNFYISNCDYFESLVDQVKAFVLLRRPNFKFYVSCCFEFAESRVPSEFFYYWIITMQILTKCMTW